MFEEITLRRSAIAYVYRESPTLRREDNLRFYDRVTAGGLEVPNFSLEAGELVLLRRPVAGRSGVEMRVGPFGPEPKLRLLMAQLVGEDPVQITRETADLIWESFQNVWGSRLSEPELTEVTLDYSAPAPGGASREFLREQVAHLAGASVRHLGREFEGFGLRLLSGPVIHLGEATSAPPLVGADVAMRIETLMDDPSQLFIQITSKWPALNVPTESFPPEVRERVKGPLMQVNLRAKQPTFYLTQVYDFVAGNVLNFLREASKS